ncbi:hypothetical protein NIES2119_23160 [[Phormidium ambiguum] IAM M-71]|uniref:Uncharacterized protein n=1 Tax=[Phormidium ambiguum] IAM M-71 TaxID=454136 RepID=A0A1U7IA71_9CYAN|nr:hypothetical protein NIES2119_23160 [Phormidium ambiguum IAM M-71]
MISGKIQSFKHFSILADIAPDIGYTRDFSYCLKITNLEKYPNYLLFVKIGSENPGIPTKPYKLIQAGDCVSLIGYRPIATIAAISKDRVQANDLENSEAGTILKNTNLQTALIQGKPIIEHPTVLPMTYTASVVEDSFQIQSIDPNGLQLSLVARSSPVLPKLILNWIIFPLVGVGILVWFIRRRKKQKGDK